jgi:NADPH:quinone reductase-like Zn-dependent oxidoreductase
MKAIVLTQYGPPDLLQFKDVPKPTQADNQVLVKVHAAAANPLDWRIMRAKPVLVRLFMGLLKPKQSSLGSDFAGCVEAVGKDVAELQPGDEVFGAKGFAGGAFAEYLCATEDQLARKPSGISFAEAAAVPVAALTALQGLRDKGLICAGQQVLIEGASGGVGTYAVQLARYFGADVTAVCSTLNVETARSLGAARVVDYTREDVPKASYDLVFGANAHRSTFTYRGWLKPGGICVIAGGKATLSGMVLDALLTPLFFKIAHKRFCGVLTRVEKCDLLLLKELMDAGKIRSVLDRIYTLSETAEALRYLEAGHARGKVIVAVTETGGG